MRYSLGSLLLRCPSSSSLSFYRSLPPQRGEAEPPLSRTRWSRGPVLHLDGERFGQVGRAVRHVGHALHHEVQLQLAAAGHEQRRPIQDAAQPGNPSTCNSAWSRVFVNALLLLFFFFFHIIIFLPFLLLPILIHSTPTTFPI